MKTELPMLTAHRGYEVVDGSSRAALLGSDGCRVDPVRSPDKGVAAQGRHMGKEFAGPSVEKENICVRRRITSACVRSR
jgi:hypothetical protein